MSAAAHTGVPPANASTGGYVIPVIRLTYPFSAKVRPDGMVAT